RLQAAAQASEATPAQPMPIVTTRSLPNRSPSGPWRRSDAAYAKAKVLMTIDAAGTLASNSSARRGSIGSTQRRERPALKPASARSRIASRAEASGRKPLEPPRLARAPKAQTVVQPVGASLPELD